MKIYITPYESKIFAWEWPNDCRIPVAGEVILTDGGSYLVRSVQWEFEEGVRNVQLRCDGLS